MKKVRLIFGIATLAVAALGANTYRFTLQEPANFNGTPLRPGDYKIEINGDKATIKIGRTVVEAPAKLETAERKYPMTTISFDDTSAKKSITEIHVGGSTTRIMISSGRVAGQ